MKLSTARRVLEDCRIAHSMMEVESDADRLRVLWIGSLGLLRLVGSVLKEIERADPRFRAAIDAHWEILQAGKDKASEQIFWKFIKGDRDRALHRYEVDLYDEAAIPLIVSHEADTEICVLGECLYVPLEGDEWRGHEAGGDARDAYNEAIQWWEAQLIWIEQQS